MASKQGESVGGMIENLAQVYPFNLAVDIFCGNIEKAMRIYAPGIEDALATLKEREQDILRLRYVEKLTMKECGEKHGIGSSRVGQIVASALRKLRHSSRRHMFIVVPMVEMQKQEDKYWRLYAKYELLLESSMEANQCPNMLDISLEYLNLSTRAYNALRRAGKRRLRDLLKMTIDDLMRIEQIGITTANEIMNCIKEEEAFYERCN